MPGCVMDRPPNICAASSAVARPVLLTCNQKNSVTVLRKGGRKGEGLLHEESKCSSEMFQRYSPTVRSMTSKDATGEEVIGKLSNTME